MGTVAVITDSSASLPRDLAAQHGIVVIPLHVVIDGVEREEGPDLQPEEVAEALVAGSQVTTSHPSPEAFAIAFQAAADAGAEAVVAVLLSSGLSGTVGAAQVAAERASIEVRVVDSKSVGMGTGFAAIAAAMRAAAGGSADDVVTAASEAASASRLYFTVDTLEYLRKGGRISAAAAAVGTMLHVRPIMTVTDGAVEVVQKVRSTAAARQAVVALAAQHAESLGGAVWAVQSVAGDVPAECAGHTVLPVHVSAVLTAHTGPSVLAVAVAPAPPEARPQ